MEKEEVEKEEKEEMEFYGKYSDVVQGKHQQLPGVDLQMLKTVLMNCLVKDSLPVNRDGAFCNCPQNCSGEINFFQASVDWIRNKNHHTIYGMLSSVCDGTFFTSLLKDMSEIARYFNRGAEKLLELHLASGFQKCFLWLKCKLQGNHFVLIQEAKDLVTYAMINSMAIQKILNKYDQVHCSKKGQNFRLEAQSMHLEILKSPWLCELMAFYINLMDINKETTVTVVPGLFEDCGFQLNEDKPSLSVTLFGSMKLNIDLTCTICLETVFDPVSLACSHIFCYTCVCSAASVSIVDGLMAANPITKCPLCRREGVFENVVHHEELSILLSRSVPEYWKERTKTERLERVQKVKEHWEGQYRAMLGI